MNVQRLIRRVSAKAKEAQTADAKRARPPLRRGAGAGHRPRRTARHRQGRARPGDRRPTSRRRFPDSSKTFCALNAANEAVVAGDERLTFADLDRISDRLAHGLVARGIAQGRPRRHRHAQLPGVDRQLHGDPQGRRRSRPCSTAGGNRTRWSMRSSSPSPKLIIADAPRAKRIAERCGTRRDRQPADRAAGRAGARASAGGRGRRRDAARNRARGRCDDPVHLGLDRRMPRARCRRTAR